MEPVRDESPQSLGGQASGDPPATRAATAAPPPKDAVGPHAALGILRQASFGAYFAGNVVSATGTWLQAVTTALLVFRLTGSTVLLGVLTFAQFVGVVALSPWAGSIADRFNRRHVLLVAHGTGLGLSLALTALAATDTATVAAVLGISLAIGIANAIAIPAQMALVTQLVDPRDLDSGIGLNSMAFNVARALGPTIAAVSVSQLGVAASLGLSSATYVFFLATLVRLRPADQVRVPRTEAGLWSSLGLVRRNPRLAIPLLVVAVAGCATDPINTLAPAWAHEMGRPDTHGGYLIGAFGAGAVTAAFWLAGRFAGGDRRLAWTLGGLGATIILFSVLAWLPLGYALLFAAGFCYLATNTHATSRLMLGVSAEHRGRVMALWSLAFIGTRPFAGLVDGVLASSAGIRWAGVALAAPALALAIWLWMRTRGVQDAR